MLEKILLFLRTILFYIIDRLYQWRLKYKATTKYTWKEVKVMKKTINEKKESEEKEEVVNEEKQASQEDNKID